MPKVKSKTKKRTSSKKSSKKTKTKKTSRVEQLKTHLLKNKGKYAATAWAVYTANDLRKSVLGKQMISNIKQKLISYLPISESILGNVFNKRYTFVQTIASGAFGTAALYKSVKIGDTVVIKSIILPSDIAMKMLIQTEVNIYKYIKSKGCNQYFTCYIEDEVFDNTIYIVFKYEQNMSDLSKVKSLLSDAIKEKVVINLIKGLEWLHSHNIAHNDIKPENILCNKDTGEIKYIDLGLGCLNSCMIAFAGTPGYMSPLMAIKQQEMDMSPVTLNDAKANDMYALSVTINTLYSNSVPDKYQDIVWTMKAEYYSVTIKDIMKKMNLTISKSKGFWSWLGF
jgi:serine/threonine protein kinase